MIRLSVSDLYYLSVMAKYNDAGQVTARTLGEEYANFLLAQIVVKEKVVPAYYVAFHFPFEGYRALHFAYGEDYVVLYESIEDDVDEQLRSRLHEVGEIVRDRLRNWWPAYKVASETEEAVLGDSWGDIFAGATVERWVYVIVYLLANLGDMLRQLFAWVASLTEYVVKTAWQRCCEPFRPFILAYVTESVLKTRSRLGDIGHAVLELFKAVVKQMIEEILEICYRSAGWLIDDFVKVIGSYVMALSG